MTPARPARCSTPAGKEDTATRRKTRSSRPHKIRRPRRTTWACYRAGCPRSRATRGSHQRCDSTNPSPAAPRPSRPGPPCPRRIRRRSTSCGPSSPGRGCASHPEPNHPAWAECHDPQSVSRGLCAPPGSVHRKWNRTPPRLRSNSLPSPIRRATADRASTACCHSIAARPERPVPCRQNVSLRSSGRRD